MLKFYVDGNACIFKRIYMLVGTCAPPCIHQIMPQFHMYENAWLIHSLIIRNLRCHQFPIYVMIYIWISAVIF